MQSKTWRWSRNRQQSERVNLSRNRRVLNTEQWFSWHLISFTFLCYILDISLYLRLRKLEIPLLLSAHPRPPRRCHGRLCCWGIHGRPAYSGTWSHFLAQGRPALTCQSGLQSLTWRIGYVRVCTCIDNVFTMISIQLSTDINAVKSWITRETFLHEYWWELNKQLAILPFKLDLDSVK